MTPGRFDGDEYRRHDAECSADRPCAYHETEAPCCDLATVPGAGHSHACPNHVAATCPTCRVEP